MPSGPAGTSLAWAKTWTRQTRLASYHRPINQPDWDGVKTDYLVDGSGNLAALDTSM